MQIRFETRGYKHSPQNLVSLDHMNNYLIECSRKCHFVCVVLRSGIIRNMTQLRLRRHLNRHSDAWGAVQKRLNPTPPLTENARRCGLHCHPAFPRPPEGNIKGSPRASVENLGVPNGAPARDSGANSTRGPIVTWKRVRKGYMSIGVTPSTVQTD